LRTLYLEADEAGLQTAGSILQEGGLVAFPTETVYGLGADATNATAVAGIYTAKQRPSFNPLIAHVSSLEEARCQGLFSPLAEVLAKAFWPGPLTLVLPLSPQAAVCDLARAGQPSVALRVPGHPIALGLIQAAGRPLAAPSANRSGRLSPVSPQDVLADLDGAIEAVLMGETCRIGLESTIIACLDGQPRLLRPGGIARETIESVIGGPLAEALPGAVQSPGMLASHYAPRALLRLEAEHLEPNEAGLDFGERFRGANAKRQPMLDLSPSRDLDEAAANLFTFLRLLDGGHPAFIAIAPIPKQGLGEAINDRLRRAAAPRS
jgi:L-threonylcarbamoyladenylate synthase